MKKIVSIIASLLVVVAASAYSPVPGGESLFDLSSPFGLSYGGSVVGGGVCFVSPTSITVNPALTAREQRIGLNVAYTGLIGTNAIAGYGSAFQSGIMIPFDWAVLTGYVNGTFPDTTLLLGNSINIKAGLAKEITNHLNVGAGINTGFTFGRYPDWALSANIGFVYDIPELAFIKDFRFGASVLNLGKNFSPDSEAKFLDGYPGFATIKAGVGGIFVSNDVIKFGASLDFTTPCFCNLIIDTGLQFVVKDMLTISVSEKINVWELSNDIKNLIPSVGIFFRFTINVKNNNYLESRDWSTSEMSAGVAYKNLYTDIHIISAGADLLLGQKDDKAPEIKVLYDED